MICVGAVLVYDITDEDSFQKVKVWVKELRRMVGADICLVIAANKADLERWIATYLSLSNILGSCQQEDGEPGDGGEVRGERGCGARLHQRQEERGD